MLDWIQHIDHSLILLINHANTPFLDQVMWIVSGKLTWFPLYLLLFILVYRKYSLKAAIWFTVFGLLAVGFCDAVTTYGVKYNVMRLRPSHNPVLTAQLHYYAIDAHNLYKGGSYGFFSGHAANSMTIALFFILQLRNYYKYIFIPLIFWVLLVCYSRMYLGVHYPTDILCGLLWGTCVALLFHWIYRKLVLRNGN